LKSNFEHPLALKSKLFRVSSARFGFSTKRKSVFVSLKTPDGFGSMLLESLWAGEAKRKLIFLPSGSNSRRFNIDESFKLLRVVEDIFWVIEKKKKGI
jgi:hypothetical protein